MISFSNMTILEASSSHNPTWRSEGPTIDGVLVPTDTVVTSVNASRSHEQENDDGGSHDTRRESR